MLEKRAEHKLGTLTFSVGYLRDKGVVEVTIIQAQKLPGLDKSGEKSEMGDVMVV